MRPARRLLLVLVPAMALVLQVFAFASHEPARDKRDVRGALDIRGAHVSEDRKPQWTTFTYEKWRARKVFDRGYVVIQFDTVGDPHFDYFALIRSDGYRLHGTLNRDYKKRDDEHVVGLAVWRPGRGSVKVKIPLGRMRRSSDRFYRWKVRSLWTGPHCKAVCIDKVPDEGAVVEPVGEPTSTPTITITPTPSDTD